MKKILFAAGISLIGLGAVYAQNQQNKAAAQTQTSNSATPAARSRQMRSPEQIADMKATRLDKEVGMTADQKKKVYDIFLKEAQENQGRAALRQETNTQVKSILTAEQNQKLQARQVERQEVMMQRKQNTRAGNLQASPAKQ